ncbi:MAG: SDR family NAD(P)-dependent oxidoreductase [Actinobacteria bacterium]|nr:SDR family NAD(P)-dependent oxidoreductase [Actinomycetota bacterium]
MNRKAEQKTTNASLEGKLCVISGATSGVGLEAAKKLAAGGADLVLVARNLEKAESVCSFLNSRSNVKIDIVLADFSYLPEVKKAAEIILNKYPKIDLLINSAGIFITKKTKTTEGFEMTFCVNHLAPFLLTSMLLERIKKSPGARIIQINSQGHRFNGFDINDINWDKRFYNPYKAYGASKTAQLLTVWEFAERLKKTRVTINAMHPGEVKTNIGNNNGPLYRWYSKNIIWHFLKDAVIAGDAIYYLAAAPELKDTSGRYFNLTIDEKPAPGALDREMSKKVWELSEELTAFKS